MEKRRLKTVMYLPDEDTRLIELAMFARESRELRC